VRHMRTTRAGPLTRATSPRCAIHEDWDARAGTVLAALPARAEGAQRMVIRLLLSAGDPDANEIAVSTTIEVNTRDPRWPAWLVDAVTYQAQEGARRLRDHLVDQQALPGDGFVPLAAVVPVAEAGR